MLHSSRGICASVTLAKTPTAIDPQVKVAAGAEAKQLESLLNAAEVKHCQRAYLMRSVRLQVGDTIHLIKPPRRLEWTETQAMLDADDIIAEAIESTRLRPRS